MPLFIGSKTVLLTSTLKTGGEVSAGMGFLRINDQIVRLNGQRVLIATGVQHG